MLEQALSRAGKPEGFGRGAGSGLGSAGRREAGPAQTSQEPLSPQQSDATKHTLQNPEYFCRKMLSSFQNATRTLMMGINNRCREQLLLIHDTSLNMFSVEEPRAFRSILLRNIQGMFLAFPYDSDSFSICKLTHETCSRAREVTSWGHQAAAPAVAMKWHLALHGVFLRWRLPPLQA